VTTQRTVPNLVYRENRGLRRMRRAVDISVALCALLVAAPVIALACAAIFCEDGGPVFFLQRRAGRFERMFTIFKLRTMRLEACEDRPSPTAGGDARITAVGRILRKTSIDELPQLFNVLRGDMSLIGPRPEMPIMVGRYESWQHLRHLISPGITCIWQTTCRSTVPLHRPQATALDLAYIERASPLLDASLLARTVLSLVLPKGAY
jgi:lipopolysaccharide/colanic/teichoic acid biosynthesis glycosyltransferase